MDYEKTVEFLEEVLGLRVTLCPPNILMGMEAGTEHILVDSSIEIQREEPQYRKFRSVGLISEKVPKLEVLKIAARDLIDGLTRDANSTLPKPVAELEPLQAQSFSTE